MMSSRASARDLSAGYVKINESELQKTGLRGRKLIIVVTCLIILWVLAVITLICNILLMIVLRMNHLGMQSMQFKRLHDERLIQFTGKHTDLGTIIVNSGTMAGYKNDDFWLVAGKVILESKDTNPPSRMIVEDGKIRLENVKNFLVTSQRTGSTPAALLFEAAKPTFRLKQSIKRLASAKIITNRVKAPVNSNLSVSSRRSLTFRGSDGDMFEAKSIKFNASATVKFRTSDRGRIKLTGRGRRGVILPRLLSMPVSDSPKITADQQGLRLCACKTTGRLFAVPGNERCRIRDAYCH